MKTLPLLFTAVGFAALTGCQTNAPKDVGAAGTPGTGLTQTTFFPMVGTENYYSPRKGKGNLMLYKSGQNYWYKDDAGKVVWLYPQGDRYYSPRPDGKTIYCFPSGKNILCQG